MLLVINLQWLLALDTNEYVTIHISLPIRINTLLCMLQTIDNLTYEESFYWLFDSVSLIDNSTIGHRGSFIGFNPNSQGRWILVISN